MNIATDNTLLAFLLALKNLENPLSENEREALAKISQKLKKNPNDWNFTEKKLMAIIKANQALNQLYQQAKTKLDALDRPIPFDLMPTEAELEKVLPPESKGGTRAHLPYGEGEPNKQSNEIFNLSVKVLPTEKPEETAKKLSFLERLSQFLNQPTSKND
ncbi:hypothetical protein [Okeania sp. SIO2B3]|uniref:hypothetical protein n=1 Tax=Okeania sp. SIO2B3 TaxID=2607784 RepID=UPI0013C1181F|nr:hypothetical protein [Okeania sp. SIO2B3]NET42727.1 hypothetical protein [Okeania sp. SIO2B3]